jgi:hypothetical protein
MCCDSGPSITQDPNVAAAAEKQAEAANRAEAFGEKFYKDTMAPLLAQQMNSSKQATDQQAQLFALQMPMAQAQAEQYQKYGLPAQQNYYNMVNQYSQPEEYERQAQTAMGDFTNAQQVQQQTMNQSLAARGIDPTSGMALGMQNQANIMGAAASSAAANRARNAARAMGMQLTAGAADFASGRPAANIGMFASGAGNASNSMANIGNSAIGAAGQAGAIPMQGYGMAANAYGSQMSTYGSLAAAQAQADAQSSAGMGSFLGSIGGALLSPVTAGGSTVLSSLMGSDRRLKKNIVRIGELDNGLSLYEYEYVTGGGRTTGVMADEVEMVLPEAVYTRPDGFKMVDYGMLG